MGYTESVQNNKPLSLALADIGYEIEMLLNLYERLWAKGKGAADQMFHFSSIEATAIHARNLIDFYERSREGPKDKRAKPDDVLAEDYGFPCKKLGLDPKIRGKINKRVAHLTYTRTTIAEVDRHWPFQEFVPQVLERSHEFVQKLIADGHHLPKDRLSKFCDLSLRLSSYS